MIKITETIKICSYNNNNNNKGQINVITMKIYLNIS